MNEQIDLDGPGSAPVADTLTRYRDERIAHLTRLCARGFSRSLSRRLAQHDVSFGHWVFLRILWQREGLTQRELSEIANLSEPTVHTALARLEKQGIVERRNLPGNKRKHHAYLTDAGKALQSKLEPLAVDANEVALVGIPEDDRDVLREHLLTILDNLERDEAEAAARGERVPSTRSAARD